MSYYGQNLYIYLSLIAGLQAGVSHLLMQDYGVFFFFSRKVFVLLNSYRI